MSDETEQLIWRSYVWSRRFVVWIAGMNPAGVEPSERAVVSKCDQELRAQFGARFADLEQQCRFARLVSLVKKAYDLDDGETCLYRSDSGDTFDVVNLSSHKTADADDYWTSWGDTASLSGNDEPFCDVAEAVVSDALAKCLLAYTAQEEATDEMYAARHVEVHRNLKREAYGRRLDVRRSAVVGEELVPVSQRHEQQPGRDVIVSSFLERMDPMIRSNTCQNAVLTRNVIFSCSSQSGPSNLHTSLKIRRRQSEQQSHENFVDIVNNTEVNDDVLEKNNLTVYVKTINKKTISICYYDSMKAAVMLEEVERRTTIPRDMTRLTHKGKAINGKKSMKDNNIKANETIEMSLRLLGGMEVNEQMDTHETEEDREKKRKLDEGKEGKATKPSDDMAHLRKDIMEALKKSDEKMECYSRKNEEKMNDFSKKADDLLERFTIITNTVGTQIQGMNSSIVKLHETNEKMKEEGENKFNKIDERFKDMEKKIIDLDKKYENRSDDDRNGNVIVNQSETVMAGQQNLK